MTTPPGQLDAGLRAVLAVAGRGELPFAPLHRRPMLQHALASLLEAFGDRVTVVAEEPDLERTRRATGSRSVRVTTPEDWWSTAAGQPGPVLVHDPLCPLVTADFLTEVVTEVGASGVSVVSYRPVTDTVKNMAGREITGTVDRETLGTVSSPLLISAGALADAGADDPPPVHEVTRLSAWLHRHGEVRMLRAPSLARRVDDLASLHLLECLDEVRRRTRTG